MIARLAAALAVVAGLAATPAAAAPPAIGVVVLSPDGERLAGDGRMVMTRLRNEGWFTWAQPSTASTGYEPCFRPGPDTYQRSWDEACVRAVLDAAPADQPQVVMVFESTRMASAAVRVTCIGRGARQTYRERVHVDDALGEHPEAGPHARVATGRCLLSAAFDPAPPTTDRYP